MANEKRLIDANALLEKIQYRLPFRDMVAEMINEIVEITRKQIVDAPTVDAVEVVHAKWVYNGRSDEYFCSNCYKRPISFRREMNCGVGELVEVCFSDYCPNCGAKMDGGNEDV